MKKIFIIPVAILVFYTANILSGETSIFSKLSVCMKSCKKMYNKRLKTASENYSSSRLSYGLYRRELLNADKDFYICKKFCNAKYGRNFN
jgi:hypothetical protein